VPKKDLTSIMRKFMANNPKKFFIPLGIFWIALGFIDLMTGTLKFENPWRAALHFVPIFGYVAVGIAWILIGIFKIGISKKSD
jgi:hypothetical protein